MDRFRCLTCTHGRHRAISRRGWDMTQLLPELRSPPPDLQLDGELVALDENGAPDFHRISSRMLHRKPGISITYFVFDVLAVEGLSTLEAPYQERRALLEELAVEGPQDKLVATFEDGQALFDAICARGLEGVVAKQKRDRYRPGEPVWVKTKNRTTLRFAQELAAARARGRKKPQAPAQAAWR